MLRTEIEKLRRREEMKSRQLRLRLQQQYRRQSTSTESLEPAEPPWSWADNVAYYVHKMLDYPETSSEYRTWGFPILKKEGLK